MKRALIIVALAACAKTAATKAAPSAGVADAAPAKPAPSPRVDAGPTALSDACWGKVQGLFAAIHSDAVAEDPHRDKTQALWRGFPDDCKRGGWYQGAAMMLHQGEQLTEYATPSDAITAGLKVDPGDPGLLAYDAYLNALDGTLAPALPPDTCDRMHAAPVPKDSIAREMQDEAVAYACGHAQLVAGAFADAAQSFGGIEDPPYPDVLLRKVQALIGAKDVKGAKKLARWAKQQVEKYSQGLGVGAGDAKVLEAQLTAATK